MNIRKHVRSCSLMSSEHEHKQNALHRKKKCCSYHHTRLVNYTITQGKNEILHWINIDTLTLGKLKKKAQFPDLSKEQ
jgi:uncharacterized protein involved in tolerance to divalent cations